MKQTVLVMSCADAMPLIGLWRPQHDSQWVTQTLVLGKESGPELLQALVDLLQTTGETWETITHIGVMHGPASYTQLRIFVATATTLAWVRNCPIVSFDPNTNLPDALPELLATAKRNQPILPVYPHEIA